MRKQRRIKFSNIGNEEGYAKDIRQFNRVALLNKINEVSTELLFSKSCNKGIAEVEFVYAENVNGIPQRHKMMIAAWNLIDLAFFAIKYTNDYRGNTTINNQELYGLLHSTQQFMGRNEQEHIEAFKKNRADLYMYLWCFGGEQFKFQGIHKSLDNHSRDLYILFDVGGRCDRKINISEIITAEVGVDWKTVCLSLLIAWCAGKESAYIADMEDKIQWTDFGIAKEAYRKVLNYYSADYQEIRSKGRQSLYQYPFVITDSKEILSINSYLNLFTYEHCIYWLVRNNYFKKGNPNFTSIFGNYFELYFKELLSDCLCEDEYRKIPENNSAKRADWELHLGEYNILIEQKASLLKLEAKQQDAKIDALKDFAQKTIIEGLAQLFETERDFNNGTYIKIVLLYEDYLKPEVIDEIFMTENCTISNDNYYWLVTIDEMERLLTVYKNDQASFNDIMKKKIYKELNDRNSGRDLNRLLCEAGYNKNQYIESEKFSKYSSDVEVIKRNINK